MYSVRLKWIRSRKVKVPNQYHIISELQRQPWYLYLLASCPLLKLQQSKHTALSSLYHKDRAHIYLTSKHDNNQNSCRRVCKWNWWATTKPRKNNKLPAIYIFLNAINAMSEVETEVEFELQSCLRAETKSLSYYYKTYIELTKN